MRKQSATVYWIEAATGEMQRQQFNSLPSSGYEAEAMIKYAIDPIDMFAVPDGQAGSDWANAQIEAMRAKSKQMKLDIAAGKDRQQS